MNNEYELRQLPLSLPIVRKRVERFLSGNGLRLDDVDYYAGVFRLGDDEILAGAGLKANVIKCVAVDWRLREENVSLTLISHMISHAVEAGYQSVRLYTKPENKDIFQSMGFHLLASAPQAVLMENTLQGIEEYKRYLKGNLRQTTAAERDTAVSGIILMNANPFTLGHRYLVEQAARQVAHLYVIVVKEDRSLFRYGERLDMVRAGCRGVSNVTVLEGSDYQISSITFPTYFLKQLDDASDTHMQLDLDLFCRHVAPALNIGVRFVGSEPTDKLTRKYNEWMHTILPQHGIEVREVERKSCNNAVISASSVREYMRNNAYRSLLPLIPCTTRPYILARMAIQALQTELDLTPKPGLVDKDNNGAHADMDYALMQKSIEALRPFFTLLAQNAMGDSVNTEPMMQIGRDAEGAMLAATGGINTHRGALFSIGLATAAISRIDNIPPCTANDTLKASFDGENGHLRCLQEQIMQLSKHVPAARDTHGQQAARSYNVRGALAEAQQGYPYLFTTWLPYLKSHHEEQHVLHKLLLLIMSQLDDTNILHRKGTDVANTAKQMAQECFESFSIEKMTSLNDCFVSRNISPGGAADMLALTVFVYSIT